MPIFKLRSSAESIEIKEIEEDYGKALPMVRFMVYYNGRNESYRDFMFEKPENANRALDKLLAYKPDIPYERETSLFAVF